jgi:hypothetical protein
MDVIEDIEKLNMRDFLRVYIYVNQHYQELKSQNARNVASAMYAVKHPETVKEMKKRCYHNRKTLECSLQQRS